jgi:hypothetical protein
MKRKVTPEVAALPTLPKKVQAVQEVAGERA